MRRNQDLLVAGALVGFAVILWAPLWTGERTFILQDVASYFYPMKEWLAATVKAGEWPWWNPWIRNGLPFAANPQVGVFYPPSVLFYLLPSTALAFNWVVILHFALLATGFYAWSRRTGRSPEAAAFAAIAIACGGTAISLTTYLNNLQAFAWIGWTWWAWWGWLVERSPRWLALAGLGFALQFLAGEPQIAVLSATLALAMGWTWPGAAAGESARRRWIDPAFALAAAAGLAALVSAVQLVPTVELFLGSRRSAGLVPGEVLAWSLDPAHLANLIVPRDFVGADGQFDLSRAFVPTLPWLYTSYLGVVTLVVVAAAPGRREPRTVVFWGAVAAVGLLLALGENNPVLEWTVERSEGVRSFRYPQKMLFLPSIAVPVLAAAGLDNLTEESGAARRSVWTALSLGALAGLGWLLLDPQWVRAVVGTWTSDIRIADPEAALAGIASSLSHVALFGVLAAGAAYLARRLRPPISALLWTALLVLDLGIDLEAAPLAPSRLYGETPAVLESLPAADLHSRVRVRTSPIGSDVYTWFTVRGITLTTAQYFLLQTMGPNLAMVHRVLAQDGAEALRPTADDDENEILVQLPEQYQVRYLRLMSVGYLMEGPLRVEGLERMSAEPIFGLYPYRVTDPLPRAYLVTRAIVEPDSVAALNHLVAGGEDPHRVAYVAGGPGLPGPAEPVDGGVRWLEGSNHSIDLEIEATSPALLVLTDRWYPGWSVSVDGTPTRLERVNWHFRGVYVDPGRHRVRFEYRPRGIIPAGLASGFGLFLALALIGWGGRHRGT